MQRVELVSHGSTIINLKLILNKKSRLTIHTQYTTKTVPTIGTLAKITEDSGQEVDMDRRSVCSKVLARNQKKTSLKRLSSSMQDHGSFAASFHLMRSI